MVRCHRRVGHCGAQTTPGRSAFPIARRSEPLIRRDRAPGGVALARSARPSRPFGLFVRPPLGAASGQLSGRPPHPAHTQASRCLRSTEREERQRGVRNARPNSGAWRSNTDAIIGGAMDSEGVEPPGGAGERVAGHTRVSAAQLASVLSRTADTLEQSAALADTHALRYEQAGRGDDAVQERRAAGCAREAARKARSHAVEWLEFAAGGKP